MARRVVSERLFARLALAALLALAAIVVTGGAVRLTGSGLGCSTWPQCEPGSYTAEMAFHPLVEFGNRLVTVAVTLVVLAVTLGSLLRRPRRRDLTLLSFGLLLGVVTQIVLGGIVVLLHLSPQFVMAHFLISMLLLLDATVLHVRAQEPPGPPRRLVAPETALLVRLVVAVVAVTITLGTVVTGAGPHSGGEAAERLPFSASVVTQLHADAVFLLLGLVLATVLVLRATSAPAMLRRRALVVLAITLGQGTIGYAQYATDLPVLLVGLHIAGATALWIAAVRLLLALTSVGSGGRDGSGEPVGRARRREQEQPRLSELELEKHGLRVDVRHQVDPGVEQLVPATRDGV